MTVITSWPSASVILMLALIASAPPAVAPASPPTTTRRQQTLLDRGCNSTSAAVQKALTTHAQVSAIRSRLDVVTRGALTGQIAFNPAGSGISLSGHVPAGRGSAFVCSGAAATPHGLGPGHSRVVATLRRSFTKPGRYTLVFRLDRRGRRILARLAAADRAYREHHPHGHRPPEIAFGVALTYVPAA